MVQTVFCECGESMMDFNYRCAKCKADRTSEFFKQYDHNGRQVWVRTNLLGRHKDHCLCFRCKKLNLVDKDKSCPVASILYAFNVAHNIVTPVWECPNFELEASDGCHIHRKETNDSAA